MSVANPVGLKRFVCKNMSRLSHYSGYSGHKVCWGGGGGGNGSGIICFLNQQWAPIVCLSLFYQVKSNVNCLNRAQVAV